MLPWWHPFGKRLMFPSVDTLRAKIAATDLITALTSSRRYAAVVTSFKIVWCIPSETDLISS